MGRREAKKELGRKEDPQARLNARMFCGSGFWARDDKSRIAESRKASGRLGAEHVCVGCPSTQDLERLFAAPDARVHNAKLLVGSVWDPLVDSDLGHGHLALAGDAPVDAFDVDGRKERCPYHLDIFADCKEYGL